MRMVVGTYSRKAHRNVRLFFGARMTSIGQPKVPLEYNTPIRVAPDTHRERASVDGNISA